jgi:hypothetical protein
MLLNESHRVTPKPVHRHRRKWSWSGSPNKEILFHWLTEMCIRADRPLAALYWPVLFLNVAFILKFLTVSALFLQPSLCSCIPIMIPFVNFSKVVAKTVMLFVRQNDVGHQKNLLLHEAGKSWNLVLCQDLLFGRLLEDSCFNSLCYRYSVAKDGMINTICEQQSSGIIPVTCSQLTQDFLTNKIVFIYFNGMFWCSKKPSPNLNPNIEHK